MSVPVRPKVLVVDDDANLRSTVCTCLESAGYAVTRAEDGAAALARLRGDAPDLVLLDLSMPRLDGMSLLTELSQRQPTGLAVRTIVMTGHGSVRTAVQAVLLGASDFLEKPFTPDDLRLSVAGVLDDRADAAGGPLTAGATYDAVLAGVRAALADGHVDTAQSLLDTAGAITDADPGFLNLAGAIHEAHGRVAGARKYYRRAVGTRPGGYAPARHNLARLDEAHRAGRPAAGPVDLGPNR